MAIVPRQRVQALDTTKLNVRGVNAAAFGGAEGAALQQTGNALNTGAQTAEIFANEHNRTQAKKAETAYSAERRELLYGEGGYFSLKGQAALDQREDITKRLGEIREKYRGELGSADSQSMYDRASEARLERDLDNIARHSLKENETAEIQATAARVENEIEESVAVSLTVDDPVELVDQLAEKEYLITQETLELADRTGKNPDHAAIIAKTKVAEMYYRGFKAKMTGGTYTAARAYLDAFSGKMTAEQQAAAGKLLEEGGKTALSQDFVDDLNDTGKLNDFDYVNDKLRQIKDPEVRKATTARVIKERKMKDLEDEQRKDAVVKDWGSQIIKGKPLADLMKENPDQFELFIEDPYALSRLKQLEGDVLTGGKYASRTTGAYAKFLGLSLEERAQFDLEEEGASLSYTEAEWSKISNMVNQTRAGFTALKETPGGQKKLNDMITQSFEMHIPEGHPILEDEEVQASLRKEIFNELMADETPTYQDVLKTLQENLQPINLGYKTKSDAFTEQGEELVNGLGALYHGSSSYIAKYKLKFQDDPDTGAYAYVPFNNIPATERATISESLIEADRDATDHDAERAYGAYVTGQWGTLSEMGLDKKLQPIPVGPQSSIYDTPSDRLMAMHSNLFGSRAEDDQFTSDSYERTLGIDMMDIKDHVLVSLEGWETHAYESIEGGTKTIGVGHKITAEEARSGKLTIGNERVDWRNGLNDDQVLELFKQDHNRFRTKVTDAVSVELNENQLEALTSFAYNVGLRAFKNSTLLKKLNNGDFEAVPSELMRWVYVNKQEHDGLKNRREKEASIFTQKD